MIPQTQPDTPFSSSNPLWPYEVFLSFSREDTRSNFTDHLYAALNRKGIITFRDDKNLEMGRSVSELFTAIEGSRYVIAVLSSSYADSTQCLDELAKAVECKKLMGQTIVPIFYHVHPTEVREQTGGFDKAFSEHKVTFKDNIEKVQRWRAALDEVSHLSGWHLVDGYESELIRTVVGQIFTGVNQTIPSTFTDLVGMGSRAEEMLSYLEIGLSKVSMIGIWGMGGMGKTTVAHVVYEKIHAQFEAYSFLANIRELTEKQGLVQLQKQLLSDLLLEKIVDIHNLEMGVRILSQRIRTKRVLIILDDVSHVKQLKALCGHKTWFGLGSRIIITARDERTLLEHEVDEIHQVRALDKDEALQLFSQKSFKKDLHLVGEDFLELSKKFITYAKGLPLVIQVLGSSLFRRSIEEWLSTLDKLKENPDKTIINVLKVSYDGLQEVEKKLFLDIACFFKGWDRHRITRILESSYGYYPVIDIKVLMEKCLVTPVGRQLWMHDMIQELGWEIVRRDSPEEVGKRSRLWISGEIIIVLANNKGTPAVQSISLNFPKKEEIRMKVNDPFLKMEKLRLLKIQNGGISGSINYLSNELALLEWHDCPLNSLPSKFQSEKLVQLDMHSSCIKQLWMGEKQWSRLTFIDMRDSQYLTKTPDFTKVPNLEKLVLEGCTRLIEVHPSIGFLKSLILLNMKNCKSLETLPPSISLKSLEKLILSACSSLKKFPEIKEDMPSLSELHLDGTAIEELPPSIGCLSGLTLLNLRECKNLFLLPIAITRLTSLRSLILAGCSEVDEIPENLNSLEHLAVLDLSGTAIRKSSFIVGMKNLRYLSLRGCKDVPYSKSWHSLLFNCWWCTKRNFRSPACRSLLLPTSLSSLTSLTDLDLSDCNLVDGVIPDDLGSLLSLEKLNLSGNNFVGLPESISQLSKLEDLNLSNCCRLKSLPKKLPLKLRRVDADDCASLVDFPNKIKVWTSGVSGLTTVSTLISSNNQQHKRSTDSVTSFVPRLGSSSIVNYGDFSVPVQVFHKDCELFNYRSSSFKSFCHENEIPEWFGLTVTRDEKVTILIPPELKDNGKWMGVAACAVFSVKRAVSGQINYSDFEASYFYQCIFGTHEFELEPFLIHSKGVFINDTEISDYHLLCVFYKCCERFPAVLNESSVMMAAFETSNPYMEVKKCGIRLLYEEDVPGFIQTLKQLFPAGRKNQMHTHDCFHLKLADTATYEAGWLSLQAEQKNFGWEKLPACKEGSNITLRENVESVLPRYLERLNHKDLPFAFFISGSPMWLNPCVGSSTSIEVPENLHKSKKWMGFVISGSVAMDCGQNYHAIFRIQRGKYHKDLTMKLRSVLFAPNGLLVIYLPRARLPKWLAETSSSRLIGAAFTTDNPGVKVQLCGLRTMYQQDLQGFVQAITHCILRSSPADMEFNNRYLVQEWINLITLVQSRQLTEEREVSTTRGPGRECNCRLFAQNNRHRDWSVDWFTCNFLGSVIEIADRWFTRWQSGDSSLIPVPPNLFDNGNWMGVAVCASLSIQEHPNILDEIPESGLRRVLFIDLQANIASAIRFRGTEHISKDMWLQLQACDFAWFVYIPRAQFTSSLNQCFVFRATVSCSTLGVGIHKCSLRLVYKDDLEDVAHMLTLSE